MEAYSKQTGKRTRKPKLENYYKVLGLRSNAKQERIKESYIALVKQYPPEQHPEQFQAIRAAYEALRDPLKRQKYDIQRKYGGSLDKMMDSAVAFKNEGKWDQAEEVLKQLLELSPKSNGARASLGEIYLITGREADFEQQMNILLEGAETEVEHLAFVLSLYLRNDRPEQAVSVYEDIRLKYPEEAVKYTQFAVQAYQATGRHEEVLQLLEADLPDQGEEDTDDIQVFISWINGVMVLQRWELLGKMQQRTRRLLKRIPGKDDHQMVFNLLSVQCMAWFDLGHFREAEVYMDFCYFLEPKHEFTQDMRKEVQEMSRVEREIEKMKKDMELFPLVRFQALEWFYEEIDGALAGGYQDGFPFDALVDKEHRGEFYGMGIRHLKTHYPIIYRRYKEDWDELYEEKTSSLNRGAKRGLGS